MVASPWLMWWAGDVRRCVGGKLEQGALASSIVALHLSLVLRKRFVAAVVLVPHHC
jgi:hypothetical protein